MRRAEQRFGARHALSHATAALLLLLVGGCSGPWNSPYPQARAASNTLYTTFSTPPRHLDPARSYAADEAAITGQTYEPLLQYAYLKRPYQLEPLTAQRIPKLQYLDAQGNPLPADAPPDKVATSVYTIAIKSSVRYQPSPAFAKNPDDTPRYDHLSAADLDGISSPADFKHQASRDVRAGDYVNEIKRLASPEVNSPILGVMSEHIVGLAKLAKRLQQAEKKLPGGGHLDLTKYHFRGAQVIDAHHFKLRIKGVYPQMRFWLAMAFFAPVPPEVTRFYHQPALADKNISIDTFPVGSGPYMLTENNPNRRMVLKQNPNFHDERYPSSGAPGDRAAGLLKDAGKKLPFIKRVVFSREKEAIPAWNKFLQGYYDSSGISSDSYGQAIRIDNQGQPHLSQALQQKGIRLSTTVMPSIFYLGFNMKDDVVGGRDERGRDLRRAISIAVDYESYISIFMNGRGVAAQGPLPPGIFGARTGKAGMNPFIYDWKNGKRQRQSIAKARKLLARAGYPGGVNQQTGRPLLLHLDTPATGPEFKSQMDWMRQQFDKLGVQLVVRDTSWPRFQQKTASGNVQLFFGSGWNADYPDPENFLFLLYGPNSAVDDHGENLANYENPAYDKLFRKMRAMPDGPKRKAVIHKMVHMLKRDAPWDWGTFPVAYSLHHGWLHNAKVNAMAQNTMKYLRLDTTQRAEQRRAWNQPTLWPLVVGFGLLVLVLLPGAVVYRQREQRRVRRPGPGE